MTPENRSGLLGCAMGIVVAVVTVAAVGAWIYDEAALQRQRAMLAGMPTGWMTLIRQRATIPASVEQLEPERRLPDNGALAVYDSSGGVWTIFQMDSAFARITEDRRDRTDAFTIAEIMADTALDHWVRWSECASWEGLDLILAHSGPAARQDLLSLRIPDYRLIRAATTALALRGWLRAEGGDRTGGERDLKAALGIGAMLARREPTMAGFLAGRAAIYAAAHGLQRLAALARDQALADLASDAGAWSVPSTAYDYDILAAVPDSALALAGDHRIALGWRATALLAVVKGAMRRPSARVLGFPGKAQRRLEALAASQGDVARLAALAAGSGRAIDAMGMRARMERFGN